jgi:hypothetical protein
MELNGRRTEIWNGKPESGKEEEMISYGLEVLFPLVGFV